MEFAWPADRVWEYLIAFEQVPLWEDGVLEVRQLTPGEPVVGTGISARRVFGGREAQLTGEVVDYQPGRSATIALRGGPLEAVLARYSVEPRAGGTSLVTYAGSGELRGPLRLLGPLLTVLGRRTARGNLARLHRRIDAGIEPRSDRPTPGPS